MKYLARLSTQQSCLTNAVPVSSLGVFLRLFFNLCLRYLFFLIINWIKYVYLMRIQDWVLIATEILRLHSREAARVARDPDIRIHPSVIIVYKEVCRRSWVRSDVQKITYILHNILTLYDNLGETSYGPWYPSNRFRRGLSETDTRMLG